MTHRTKTRRLTVAAAATCALGLAACSSGGGSAMTPGGSATGGGGEYTVWDPYPQFEAGSTWWKLVESCGSKAGVTIKHAAFDTTDLTNKALLAAQQGTAPDVLIVDNPVVSTLAEAGALTTTQDLQADTSSYSKNLLAAGQLDGKTYGVPIGANTLALFYNKKVLAAAGVSADRIRDWSSLTAALAKVKAAGKKGITFSAIGTEEGSFQFLPWFWGSGAQLTKLDSPEAVSALTLWTDWLKQGYAPNSVINNTQTTSWQEFATGNYAFAENGTWQIGNAEKSGLSWGVIPIPSAKGGPAPAPTGGEFVTAPVQKDAGRYPTSAKLVACLTQGENALETDTALSYVAASAALQTKQAADPKLAVWVKAVQVAKGRTSDNLGTKYPRISEPLWGAFQASLSKSKSPQAALQAAQATAASAVR